jgi:hypothetical protein
MRTIEIRDSAELVEGDGLLVLRSDEPLSQEEARRIAKRWRESVHLPRAHSLPLVILDGGLRLEELSGEELARIGLQRIPED